MLTFKDKMLILKCAYVKDFLPEDCRKNILQNCKKTGKEEQSTTVRKLRRTGSTERTEGSGRLFLRCF